MKKITGGIFIPVCSPCDENGRFLEKQFLEAVETCMQEPVEGVYVCGGTGEGTKMRLSERKAACEIAVDVARSCGKTVLTHIGAYTMRDALELAAHAAAAGADGVSTIALPGEGHPVQMRYYNEVVQVSGLQTILYYMPSAGSSFSVSEILETLTIPGVTGIKSSPNDFFFTLRLLEEKPDDVFLFNGKDEYLAAATIHGAAGGIGLWANVFPKAYSNIFRLAAAGRLAEAFRLQSELNALCFTAFRHGLLESFECINRYLGRWDRVFRAPAPRFSEEFYRCFIAEAGTMIDSLVAKKELE